MSRKEIVGTTHTIAFGVDHANGAFVQLWLNPSYDQDCALIVIDSNGIRTDNENKDQIDKSMIKYLVELQKRIDAFCKNNPGERFNLSESDVVAFGNACGKFPNLEAEVYRIFGDDI